MAKENYTHMQMISLSKEVCILILCNKKHLFWRLKRPCLEGKSLIFIPLMSCTSSQNWIRPASAPVPHLAAPRARPVGVRSREAQFPPGSETVFATNQYSYGPLPVISSILGGGNASNEGSRRT